MRQKIKDFMVIFMLHLVLTLPFFTAQVFADTPNNQTNNSTAQVDNSPLTLTVSIPGYVNRRVIDISGSTKTNSIVSLYVNDLNTPRKTLSSSEVAVGKFYFSQVQLQDSNNIKITATDKLGNTAEKTFEVGVDTESPVVKLSSIVNITSKIDLNITGSVNEPVTVNVFIDSSANNSAVPPKIKKLNSTKISQNSVELKWEASQDRDFSHYVIYRNSIPIATASPSSFTVFTDALVDSGKEYIYQLSEVNIFGKEGPKSDTLAVKTLDGGAILNANYPPVDIFEEFRKPAFTTNASNNFNMGIKLTKGDGTYGIKLIFEDKAGNKFTAQKILTLDTKKPAVKIITPPTGSLVYENVAHEVDIIGKTEPNARVHLFIDRTPFSFDTNVQLAGLPNEAQNVPQSNFDITADFQDKLDNASETALESKCKSNLAIKTSCKDGADRSTTADKDGNFKFEKVDLTSMFGLSTRITEVPITDFRDTVLNSQARDSKKANILVVATDQVGQRGFAKSTVAIGTCWSGNLSWDVIPLTQFQSPTLLSTERMAEGTEALYFYFNYSYIGRGSNARITGVSLAKACGTRELMDPRFNISCRVMPAGDSPVKLNKPDNTLTYSVVPLNRFEGMDKFLGDDWKSFLKSINSEMSFPYKLRITYEHDVIDDNGQSRRMTETQTSCQEVSYVIDNTLIDPRRVMPDFMLYGFVDFLQSSINTLTKVQEQIDKVVDYVGMACLYSFFAHLVFKIYRNWVELSTEKFYWVKQAATSSSNDQQSTDECKTIIEQVGKANNLGKNELKLKYFSDPNLKKCFSASSSAWKRETDLYEIQRWSCDRIFGHSSPSKWTETKPDDELLKKIEEQKSCSVDQTARGLPLNAIDCRKINLAKYTRVREFDPGTKCFETTINGEQVLYTLGKNVRDNIFQIEEVIGPSRVKISYAIKQNENNYLKESPKSCSELCGIKSTSSSRKPITIAGQNATLSKDLSVKKNTEAAAACITVNQCRQLNANKKITDDAGAEHKINSAYRMGYASKVSDEDSTPCFYDGLNNPNVVSDDPNQREECCCINAEENKQITPYYQYGDVDAATGGPVHESKQSSSNPLETATATTLEDMKWSYRYWRIGYVAKGTDGVEHYQYNPSRYIEGRDKPACFGQDSWFYKIFGKEQEVLIINPFKQDTAALQCAYLTGVNQRLQMYKNIMAAMSSCLIEVRQNGRADSGVCKELFTQHVCGLLSQLISFFVNGCTPDNEKVDTNADNGFGDDIKLGLKSIAQGISEGQQEFSQEYQNAKLNNLLGIGEGGVARKICLGAFGYDWSLTANNLIDAAYTSPFATLVQPVTKTREFLTVDPVSAMPKYEYRASWIVNPGCDLDNYRIDLACVTQREADKYAAQGVRCGSVGAASIGGIGSYGTSTAYNNCDCLGLNQEQGPTFSFFSPNQRFPQNKMSNLDHHLVVEQPYRYDHLKFTLRTDRRIPANIQQNCFPPGYENGVFYFPLSDKTVRDIADCTVEPLTGVFKCGGGINFNSRKGTLRVDEVRIISGDNDVNAETNKDKMEFTAGNPLSVQLRLTKSGKDKCIRASLLPDLTEPRYEGITSDGINDVRIDNIADSLSVVKTSGNIATDSRISVKAIEIGNQNPVSISVQFQSDNPTFNFQSEQDKVMIEGLTNGFESVTKYLQNGKLVVAKDGDIIEITGVALNPPQPPLTKPYTFSTTITVRPPEQSTSQTGQQKTLLLEFFNIKDSSTAYGSKDDCNPNDKIMERPYKFMVSPQGVDAIDIAPSIDTPRVTPSSPRVGEDITISARVKHKSNEPDKSGIESVKLIIPGQSSPFDMVPDSSSPDLYTITLKSSEVNLPIGSYSGTIQATAKEGKSPINNKAFSFSVRNEMGAVAQSTSSTGTATPSATNPPTSTDQTKNILLGTGSISGIRPEVINKFNEMSAAASKDGVTLSRVSDYRRFSEQLSIWNGKFNGLFGTEQEKVQVASQYSAVPGLSRHHFGTDIDINGGLDGSLNPPDYTGTGKYANLYKWLQNNAARFGFCQPYNRDNGVVKTEPWHWSYKPISSGLTQQHMSLITVDDIRGKGIQGETTVTNNFDFYHRGFISDINPDCLS